MAHVKPLNSAYAALGDPMRRTIFERLAIRPAPVGELAGTLPVSRSAVSQHLRVLKDAQLVTVIQNGTRRIYRVDPRGIGAMRDWLDGMWKRALHDFTEFADTPGDEADPK